MKKLVLICATSMLFLASAALADDCGNGKDHGKGTPSCGKSGGTGGNGGNGGQGGNGGSVSSVITNDNLNVNLNNVHNTSKSSSNSTAVGTGISVSSVKDSGNSSSTSSATGGNASSVATGGVSNATNGGQSNSQTTEYTNNEAHQVATAYAPTALPSAPCRVSGSLGLQGPMGGLSAGGSKLDKQCDLRETARAFALLGDIASARAILLTTDAAKKAKLK